MKLHRISHSIRRCSHRGLLATLVSLSLLVLSRIGWTQPDPAFPNKGPLSPREEQATFRLIEGFRIELAACEPNVVDPVAMAFDEQRRLFVAEMRGYPNEGIAKGDISSGRIRVLEDRDGDGFFEHSVVFADHLRFPTAVIPYRSGLLVANAPDLIYLKDTDDDNKADRTTKLYTGFDLGNIQQLLNSLQWGLDNWVHGVAGSTGGIIRSAQKPDGPTITLRGRGIRFRPDSPGSLEPTSGGGQFGLAQSAFGQWFTATNSQHLRHIVLPDQYLGRNPLLPVREVTIDISDHGSACKVHRISPFESWRVERTRRRKTGPDADRFPSTELIPGGFITSACSPLIYEGGLFPNDCRGLVFVCDPANNLIHRDHLIEKGATYIAQRVDTDREFLASTDNWFRPVHLTLGPDGAIYVADFYREVIETPLSLPEDIKKAVNLQSRGRGRIWRIVPLNRTRDSLPHLGNASATELVKELEHANQWRRLTSQRLLVERQDRSVIKSLRKLARDSKSPEGRVHALWTLDGLSALTPEDVIAGLQDEHAGVREQTLRLSEQFLQKSPKLVQAILGMTDDESTRVRFQLAFTLGEVPGEMSAKTLAKLAKSTANDEWTETAILSSAGGGRAITLLRQLVADGHVQASNSQQHRFLTRLATLVASTDDEASLRRAFEVLVTPNASPQKWQSALLEGLAQGLSRKSRSLEKLWHDPPETFRNSITAAQRIFDHAAMTASDKKQGIGVRLDSIRLLAFAPFDRACKVLTPFLAPQSEPEIQLAAVRALASHNHAAVADLLLTSWRTYSPQVRREVVAAMFATASRTMQLLKAIEDKHIQLTELEPTRLAMLKSSTNRRIRERAGKLLKDMSSTPRHKIVETYESILALKSDSGRGRAVFRKHCATCHRLENFGFETGANLESALSNKTPKALLIDILDPNREVDPRYLEYVVVTKAGKVLTGRVFAETATSITLRRAENQENIILRSEIDSIQATTRSLMPEGLEMQLSQQEIADVINYLLTVRMTKSRTNGNGG